VDMASTGVYNLQMHNLRSVYVYNKEWVLNESKHNQLDVFWII